MNARRIFVECICGDQCGHRGRRAFETDVSSSWEYDHPLLAFYADEFKSGNYPLLKLVLARLHVETVLLHAREAAGVLTELNRLETHPLPGSARVLVDDAGERVWPVLEPDGLGTPHGFHPLFCRPGLNTDSPDVLVVGTEGDELVVRRPATAETVLRCTSLQQDVGEESILVSHRRLCRVTFRDASSAGKAVTGFAEPIHYDRMDNLLVPPPPRAPRQVALRQVPLMLGGTLSFPRWLKPAAHACLQTSKPLVAASGPSTHEHMTVNPTHEKDLEMPTGPEHEKVVDFTCDSKGEVIEVTTVPCRCLIGTNHDPSGHEIGSWEELGA